MINDSEQKAIEELKKDLDIEIKECSSSNDYRYLSGLYLNRNVETVLNLISKLQSDIDKRISFEAIKELKKENEDLKKYVKTECVTKTTLKKFIKYHLSDESHKDTKELLERLL